MKMRLISPADFANNRDEARGFLERKWRKELDYRLIKETGHSTAIV